MTLPKIILIHICLYQSVLVEKMKISIFVLTLMRNEKRKKKININKNKIKNNKDPLGNEIVLFALFAERGEMN